MIFISAIGTHSLRGGGATATANAGVQDRLFTRHGRWASELAKVYPRFFILTFVGFLSFRYLVFSFLPVFNLL